MIQVDIQREGVAVVTIDRADKANSLAREAKRELADTLRQLDSAEDVSAMVVTGAGERVFCAGSDIAQMSTFDASDMYNMLEHERALYLAAIEAKKPVVAAVNGHALGAGLNLVMSCDYVVSVPDASFGAPELSIGVCDPLEGFLLPFIVGFGTARAMYYTGRRLAAEAASDHGLVHEIVDRESFLTVAVQRAQEISSLPSTGFRVQKELLARLLRGGDLDGVIQASHFAAAFQFSSGETQEAMSEFS